MRLLTLRTLIALALPATLTGVATAGTPIIVDKSQAVSGPRTDPGGGLCGSATHFAGGQQLSNKADAVTILDKPETDPAVLGRTTKLFDNINLRNSQSTAAGDFTPPTYPDSVFPYSMDTAAMPMGTDSNFIVRLRGYFNVPAALTGKTISFGMNCDDFCALRIGTMDLPPGNQLVSGRIIKQVSFRDAGLYPIELVYFQKGSMAYLEMARSDGPVEECPNDICQISLTDATKYPGNFKLLAASELYNSVAGVSAACKECGTAGATCAAGSYCGEGLCQACNNSNHCGTSCQACPSTASQCSSGQCVACTENAQCASGSSCNKATGECTSTMTTTPMEEGGGGSGCTLGKSATTAARGGLVASLLMVLAVAGLLRRRGQAA